LKNFTVPVVIWFFLLCGPECQGASC
jgi:hypothetical protein